MVTVNLQSNIHIIQVHSPKCVKLIEDGTIGIGQLFKHMKKLPTFLLLDAGRAGGSIQSELNGGIWRTYKLQCEEITCLICEEFHHDVWNVAPYGHHANPSHH
jgi:hypothetical protein